VKITEEPVEDILVFTISGNLDSDTINDATVQMNAWLERGWTRFVGDLRNLQYITSAGLLLLFTLGKKAAEGGGWLCLCNVRDQVEHVFDVCGLPDKIPVADSREQAMRTVRG